MTDKKRVNGKSTAAERRSRNLNDEAVRFHLQNDVESAKATYAAAVQANPKNASAHNNLGFLLAQAGELKEALKHLRRAVKLDPQNGNAQVNLGQALAADGKIDAALAALQK